MIDALAYLPATRALELMRGRELSPVELVEAVIARAEATEPAINAYCERWAEQALAAARIAEQRFMSTNPPRPLEGLPLALKEEHSINGHPLRLGFAASSTEPATQTHEIIRRAQDAGAVTLGRTATPEISCAGFTHTRLWGVTRNPWHLDKSPGGSSGGSAAALAAGSATLATGSDIAGSIRMPAAMCGVVGFKPPHGRVPDEGPYRFDPYCINGALGRTVGDCALLHNVLAGPHWSQPAGLPRQLPLSSNPTAARGLSVAVCQQPGDYPIDPDIVANTATVAEALVHGGARVHPVELHWRHAEVLRAAFVHFASTWTPLIEEIISVDPDAAMPYTRDLVRRCREAAERTTAYEGLLLEGEIWDELARVFEGHDALLCPTLALPAFGAGVDYVDSGPVVAGEQLSHHFEAALTIPFNIAGRCPVLAVPSGLARDGVPTSVQIVGRPYEDPVVFDLGGAIEAAGFGFGGDPDWRPAINPGERR